MRSFFKTRVTNQGVVNEQTRNVVFVPDAEHSDTEDLVDDDKDVQLEDDADMPVSDESDESPDSDVSESSGSGDDEGDEAVSSDSESEGEDIPIRTAPKKPKLAGDHFRWRKRAPMEENSSFSGPDFPDPPREDLSPLKYFKMFFDDELISTIVEQTNLYSVQTSNRNINTNKNEIEQFLGILVMMGILKYPQYKMYWLPETRIPAIADCMSINRFQNLKRYFHINDNSSRPRQNDPNYDKLYRIRPMLDSLVSKCREVPP